MKYEKVIKWILLALFIVGAVLSFYGFGVGFESDNNAPVDNILYCAYGFSALTIAAVVFGVVVIGGINNPMSLVKLLIGLVVIAAIVAGAYFLAPGTPHDNSRKPIPKTYCQEDSCLVNRQYHLPVQEHHQLLQKEFPLHILNCLTAPNASQTRIVSS